MKTTFLAGFMIGLPLFLSTVSASEIEVLNDVVKHPQKYQLRTEVNGQHDRYEWQTIGGVTFCVVPCGGGGTRLTQNISHSPFAEDRRVEFRLLNVKPEHRNKLHWEVKSDVDSRGDGHRQDNDHHKTSDGDTIMLDGRAGKDRAYYLAGRWDRIEKDKWFDENPRAAVLLILR